MFKLFVGIRISLCALGFLVAFQPRLGARADAPETAADVSRELADAEQAAEDLHRVFQQISDNLTGRTITLRDVETVGFWSERILEAQGYVVHLRARQKPGGILQAEPLLRQIEEAIQAHANRLATLEQRIQAAPATGQQALGTAAAARALAVLARGSQRQYRRAASIELELASLDASPSGEAIPQSNPRSLLILIDAEGTYRVMGNQVSLSELQAMLDTAYMNNPRRAAVDIRSDRQTSWEAVVAVLDACRKAKITDCRVSVASPEER